MPARRTTTTAPKKTWDERAQELIDFHHENGHFTLPGATEYNGLRCWMKRLREWHERNEQQGKAMRRTDDVFALTEERVEELNSIGFPWKVKKRNYKRHEEKDTDEGRWQRRLQDLRDFKQKHGHMNVPSKTPENESFGIWIVFVRKTFRKVKKGNETTCLTTERIVELDNLGFPWVVLRAKRCSDQSEEQREQELLQEEEENKAFLKKIHRISSKQPTKHQSQPLSTMEETNEGATLVQIKQKRKKEKRKVPTKQTKKKQKRKVQCCDETYIQPPNNKKHRKSSPEAGVRALHQPRNKRDNNRHQTQNNDRSETDNQSSSLSSRRPKEQANDSVPVAEAPPTSNLAEPSFRTDLYNMEQMMTPDTVCKPTSDGCQPKVPDDNASSERPQSLGERLRAKFENRLIVISL